MACEVTCRLKELAFVPRMPGGCISKLRRGRLGKKWTSLSIFVGLSIFYLFFFRPQQETKLEGDIIVKEGENKQDLKNKEDNQDKQNQEYMEQGKNDDLLPADILREPVQQRRLELRPRQKKTNKVKNQSSVLDRMEKTLLREAAQSQKEIDKLPKPKQILSEAVGPAPRLTHTDQASQGSSKQGVKLVVIARQHSGYPVLGQFLTEETDFFEHREPPGELDLVTNILNCVLRPEMVDEFGQLVEKTRFGDSRYFRESCLLDSRSVCSDPLSYETSCSRKANQLVRTQGMGLGMAGQLLDQDPGLRVVLLVRDPRGVLARPGMGKQAGTVCSNLTRDLDMANNLLNKFPGQFGLARYELLATRPVLEVGKLFESLGLVLPVLGDTKGGWSLVSNKEKEVNKWKQRLSKSELQKVENKCLDALSKLEYQPLGQGVS